MKKESFLVVALAIFSLALLSFSGCDKDPEIEITIKAPSLQLVSIDGISETEATVVGRISNTGGSNIKERGVYLDGKKKIISHPLNSEPTFTVKLSNLEPNSKYTVSVYAENSQKIGYSSSLEFSTVELDLVSSKLEIKAAKEIAGHSALLQAEVKNLDNLADYEFSFDYGLEGAFTMTTAGILSPLGSGIVNIGGEADQLKIKSTYSYRLKVKHKSGKIYYSETATLTTSGNEFSIDGTGLKNVATDKDGNVYASGFYFDKDNDIFIVKFNPQGTLTWQKSISGETVKSLHNITVANNVIYAQVVRGSDPFAGYWGTLSIDAYDSANGNLLWSTVIRKNTSSADYLVTSEDNFIYSSAYGLLSKLDLSGNIVAEHQLLGSKTFESIVSVGSKVLVVGSVLISQKDVAVLWFFDENLNIIWSKESQGDAVSAYSSGLAYFPDKKLIFVTETHGDTFSEIPMKSYILCYEHNSTAPVLKWKKFIDGSLKLHLKKEGNNFYAYSADYNFSGNQFIGPALFNTAGEIVWQASGAQKGNLAIFGNNLYLAQGNDKLVVIKK